MPDREKVMKGLECCIDINAESSCRECPYYNHERCDPDDVLRDALALLKEQEAQWIPVTERLPEIGRVVLAMGHRSASTGQFQGLQKSQDHFLWNWKGHTIRYVSHWMPLPEPPKEEDNA